MEGSKLEEAAKVLGLHLKSGEQHGNTVISKYGYLSITKVIREKEYAN